MMVAYEEQRRFRAVVMRGEFQFQPETAAYR